MIADEEAQLGKDHPSLAGSLNNLALSYRKQRRFSDAEPLYKRSIDMLERSLGPTHPYVAGVTGNLAALYSDQGRFSEIEPLYQRILSIQNSTLPPNHPQIAFSLDTLANLYVRQRRYDDAAAALRRGLVIQEANFGPNHPNVATTLANLATIYFEQGQSARAEEALRRAISIDRQSLNENHPTLSNHLSQLGGVLAGRREYGEAYHLGAEALEMMARRVLQAPDLEDEGQAAERRLAKAAARSFLNIASLYVQSSQPLREDTADLVLRAAQVALINPLDQALAQMTARLAASSSALSELVRKRREYVARRTALDTQLLQALGLPSDRRNADLERTLSGEMRSIDQALEAIQVTLSRDFPRFTEIAYPKPLSAPEAQRLLAANEALVSFIVDDQYVYRVTVSARQGHLKRLPIGRLALEDKVRLLRIGLALDGAAGNALPSFDAHAAYSLFEILFGDMQDLPDTISTLLIVPDGSLASLPFSALLMKPVVASNGARDFRSHEWLARRYAVAILPGIGALRSLRGVEQLRREPGLPFVGFGDPLLSGSPELAQRSAQAALVARGAIAQTQDVLALPPLPETAQELKEMALSLDADPTSTVFTGASATEARVRSMDLDNVRVLAFATHALMAGEFRQYGEPALVLTPPSEPTVDDDGLLGASEIARLKLAADWVILSACNTAASDGTPGAPGLSGLAQAFIFAGTRALLVSQWSVDNSSAARLTVSTVESARTGSSKAQALQTAMLNLLDDRTLPSQYSHPAFWAPFMLVGD